MVTKLGMPITRQDRFSVAAALGLLALIAVNVFAATTYVDAQRWVDHTLEVRQEVDEWMIALSESESATRAYVTSGAPIFIAPFDAAMHRERARASALRSIVADNAVQIENVEAADRHAQAVTGRLRELVALVGAGHRDDAIARVATGEGQTLMNVVRADAARIRGEEERLLGERRARAWSQGGLLLGGGSLLTVAAMGLLWAAWSVQRKRVVLLNRLATEAQRRLESLSDVATALSEARSRGQVADAVIARAMSAAGADTCTLYLLDDAGTALDLLGERGTAPEVVDKIRRITASSGNPGTFASMTSGSSIWAENEAEYAAIFPALATMKAHGRRAKAFWSVPLVVEGERVGLLGMGFYEPRAFPPEERAFIETLTKQCAQAIVRASHMEREDEARRWSETTLGSIGDAVIATDADGRVTFMNAVAERLTAWSDADARGRPLDEVFCILAEATREVAENPVATVLREGRIVGLANHTILRSKRGEEIPIDDSAAPIRDQSGRLFGVVLVFRNVSDEKRAHVQRDFLARASEALVSSLDYRTTLATVARSAVPQLADWCAIEVIEAGATTSQQVAVAHVDPAKAEFARELGERYPPDPHAATGVPNVIRTGTSELYVEIPAALLEAGAKDAEHLRIIRELRLESAMVVPLRGRARVLGAMTFVYAASGRRYSENDLAFAEDFGRRAAMAIENAIAMKEVQEAQARERRMRDEAEIANGAKDEFLAVVSHELRTPLHAILGWTIALRDRKPGDDIDRPLGIIERNARAQAKLVEDVLDVSRIISGKLTLKLGMTNVADAVNAAIETVAAAAEAKGIAVSVEVEQGPLVITADFDRLQQIVWNLVTNAVKFTPKGGKVSVRVFREGSDIRLSVSDTGEGIRREALPRVFERFQQADASTTRRHGGLGLGLAIVRHLVTAHGGTVSAESEGEGKGATFLVSLPARSAVPALSARASSGGDVTIRLDGLRVLVVDDEEDSRTLVGAVLGNQGADVHLVDSAAAALEKVALIRPDVIVSDIGMPQMDGYELMRKIRALSPANGGRTPGVALTAYARAEDSERAFAAGFQRHVAKPIEPTQLAIVVATLGGRSN